MDRCFDRSGHQLSVIAIIISSSKLPPPPPPPRGRLGGRARATQCTPPLRCAPNAQSLTSIQRASPPSHSVNADQREGLTRTKNIRHIAAKIQIYGMRIQNPWLDGWMDPPRPALLGRRVACALVKSFDK
ncbi:hypothetical protein PLESTM_000193800 [Pleodorina starrii]|nr:hypothetical protein PLESTM_000193800 [Pleodorina starrii]